MLSRLRNSRRLSPHFNRFIESKPVWLLLSLFDWPRQKIRQLYGWVTGWAQTRQATKALAAISFMESSFFPVPPDPLLIAMTIAKPSKYLRFAGICTIASVAGGLFGYIIGIGLFETVGKLIVDTYHLHEEFTAIGIRYDQNAFLTIFTAAFTPIPYKLITIAAGVFRVNILELLLASILGRGARFFLVAGLMHHFGKRYKDKIEKYIDVLSLLFVALMIGGLTALKYL
jgi:membrane protein YqaA with SNARE-associated domain